MFHVQSRAELVCGIGLFWSFLTAVMERCKLRAVMDFSHAALLCLVLHVL